LYKRALLFGIIVESSVKRGSFVVECFSMNETLLPNDFELLKAIIRDQETLILDQKKRYELRIEFLEERLRLLQNELFRRSSEKRPSQDEDGRQLHLFNEAEAAVLEEEPAKEEISVPAHTRTKPKRKPLPDHLPRVEVIVDIAEEEKVCGCGTPLSRIGEEVSEKLDIIPATVRVLRTIRPKYACKACEGVESEGKTVKIAEPSPEMVPKGLATAGTLAYVATAKYADGTPLYRLAKILDRYGIEIPRSTMASWMVKISDRCQLIMEYLKSQLLSGSLINCDETPVQVLNEPGRANTTKSYMWVFRGGDPQKPVVLFHYAPTRSGEVPREILLGYQGYLQTDAYSAYEQFEKKGSVIILVGCMAHVRRNFVKVIDARGKGAKKSGSAEVALEYIRKLYAIEKIAREKGLSPEQILALRKEKAEPILKEFKAWMDDLFPKTPPKGLLGKALSYARNHWPKIIRYLEDGRIPIDNNMAENAIRPFVVGRKNWLFSGHPNGAHAAATLYSLIETAKACGLEPYQFLRHLFEKLPFARTEEDYQALLPQRLSPELLSSSLS
jgi:transposase